MFFQDIVGVLKLVCDANVFHITCPLILNPCNLQIALTLSPTAEKRRPYTRIRLRRPRATTIVVGMNARRWVLSLLPAYEVCV